MKSIKKINPEIFFGTKDARSDANYWVNKIKTDSIQFSDIFEVVAPDVPDFNDLPNIFNYCEIGNLSSSEVLVPNTIYISQIDDETDDNAKLHKKIFKKHKNGWKTDDIMQVEFGDILISKVRPLLNKVILINEDNQDYYFTKAFIRIKIKDKNISPEMGYYIVRILLNKEFIAISRIGKSGYPAIKTDDLEDIVINLDLEKMQNSEFNDRIQELHKKKIDAYKFYIETIESANDELKNLFSL